MFRFVLDLDIGLKDVFVSASVNCDFLLTFPLSRRPYRLLTVCFFNPFFKRFTWVVNSNHQSNVFSVVLQNQSMTIPLVSVKKKSVDDVCEDSVYLFSRFLLFSNFVGVFPNVLEMVSRSLDWAVPLFCMVVVSCSLLVCVVSSERCLIFSGFDACIFLLRFCSPILYLKRTHLSFLIFFKYRFSISLLLRLPCCLGFV